MRLIHWSVADLNKHDSLFCAWPKPVSGSLLPADEIDGKTTGEAVNTLEALGYQVLNVGHSKNYPMIRARKPI